MVFVKAKSNQLTFSDLFNVLHSDKPQSEHITELRGQYPTFAKKFEMFECWFKNQYKKQFFKQAFSSSNNTKKYIKKIYPAVVIDFFKDLLISSKGHHDYSDVFEKLE